MNNRKKGLLVVVVSFVILSSGFIMWSATRASVPDDVMPKLDSLLIRKIQLGTWSTKQDCIVSCYSEDNMTKVIGTLPPETIEDTWDSFGIFHAFLIPEQIFSIARMDEVRRIDYNGIVTVQ